MKTTIKFPTVSILIALMFAITFSCKEKKPPPPPPPPPPVIVDPPPPPPPPTKADLSIQSVRLEKAANPDKWYTHTLIVKVRNNGESIAKGFNVGCTYNCPAGLTKSAGADVVQGGYIAGNSEFTYRAMFHIYCDGPPAIMHLKVQIDANNKVAESNENNNEKFVQVQVPF